MKNTSIKKNLLVLAFSGLLALLLIPTDSFAQSRKMMKKERTATKATSSTKHTVTRTRTTTTQPTRTRTATNRTRTATYANTGARKRQVTRQPATPRATRSTSYTNRRDTRATATQSTSVSRARTARTNTTSKSRYNSTRNTSAEAASNYNYRNNQQNNYCNDYYRGVNNWNRTFWTSVNYTPAYYDLFYNRFPNSNGLRSQKFRFFGDRYWLYDGIWFQKRFGRYYATDAPVGLCLDRLPIGGDVIWYRGDRFVIYRGTAYKMLPFGGFQVVPMLTRF